MLFFAVVFLCIAQILFVLFYPDTVRKSVNSSLQKLISSVLPPLFCFIFAGDILIQTPFVRLFHTKPMKKLAKKLNLSPMGIFTLFSGVLFGFPSGAAMVSRLISNGEIDKKEAQRLVSFSNNPSPAFLVAVVGQGIMKNAFFGWLLYFASIFTTFFVAYISGKKEKNISIEKFSDTKYEDIGKILTAAANKGISACLNICAFTVIFGVCCDMIFAAFTNVSPFIRGIISGFLEITRGVFESGNIENFYLFIASISICLGFSGVSVAMQISSLVEKYGISLKKYFLYRIIYIFAYISSGIFFIIFR